MMEIIARKNDLVKELMLVQGIVERKNSIPILSNVLCEARGSELRISATDLDVSLRCGSSAQVVKEGAITLGAKKLFEITRALPESDIHLKVLPESWTEIRCERSTFKMAGLPSEDFPSLPEARAGRAVEVPAPLLRGLIARTAFAITAEDARYYLAGALLLLDKEGAAMVATDGHRLSYARSAQALEVKEPQRVLVPRKAISELGRLLEGEETATFQQVENHLVFTVGGRILASKMIEGQFPAFEKVIAVTGDKVVKLQREVLGAALRRVSLLSSERSRAVRLGLAEGQLELLATSPDLGEAKESVVTTYRGGPVEIGFNAQYLLDFLSVVGTDEIELQLKDAESQGLLRPAGGPEVEHRYVVMPMRF
jgi:DNA polymerase-3 subunit beta